MHCVRSSGSSIRGTVLIRCELYPDIRQTLFNATFRLHYDFIILMILKNNVLFPVTTKLYSRHQRPAMIF